jgi:hypothetical protein
VQREGRKQGGKEERRKLRGRKQSGTEGWEILSTVA